MTRVRTLGLAALALTLAACACFMRPPAGGGSCQPLSADHAATISATRTPNAGLLRVPVVIHLMPNPQDPTSPPEAYWTPARIDTYFGAGNLSVNHLWRPAGIHFALIRVERCVYTPPAGTYVVLASGAWGMLPPDPFTLGSRSPAEQQAVIDHYLQLNVDYGCCRALNVYLWRTISGAANGYGESPRRNRPEVQQRHLTALPTVWFESGLPCGGALGDACQRGLAHEFGHALGLRHPCDACTCCAGGVAQGAACPCEGSAPGATNACGEALGCCDAGQAALGRLMFPGTPALPATGLGLCSGEISEARSGAQEFF